MLSKVLALDKGSFNSQELDGPVAVSTQHGGSLSGLVRTDKYCEWRYKAVVYSM